MNSRRFPAPWSVEKSNARRTARHIDPNHRGHLLRAQRRGEEGTRGGLWRLRSEAFQPTSVVSENQAIPVL